MSRLVLQVSHNQEVGAVLTSSTALTFLCSPSRRNKSTSYWCARKREKSSLYSRMAMWWTWTQNLVSSNQTRASFALWSGWMQTEHFTHWNKRWRCTFIFRHPFLNVEKNTLFFVAWILCLTHLALLLWNSEAPAADLWQLCENYTPWNWSGVCKEQLRGTSTQNHRICRMVVSLQLVQLLAQGKGNTFLWVKLLSFPLQGSF